MGLSCNDTGSMRGIKQDQLPFYYHSELELELLIDEKLSVAVIQYIIVDQKCRFKFIQRSGIEKDRCFSKIIWFVMKTNCLASPTAQSFWSSIEEDEQF